MRERGAPTVPTTMALEKVRARARLGGRNGTRARTAHMSTWCSRRCILSPRGRRPTPSSAPTRLRCRSASAWPAARSARCGPRPASEKTTSNENDRLGLRGVCSGLTGRSKRRTPGSPTAGASSEARRLWRSPNHDEAAVEVAQPRLVHIAATVPGSERARARERARAGAFPAPNMSRTGGRRAVHLLVPRTRARAARERWRHASRRPGRNSLVPRGNLLVFVHMRAALGAYAVFSGAAAAAAAGAGVLPGMLAGADLFSRSLSLLNFCSSWRGRMGGVRSLRAPVFLLRPRTTRW